MVSIVTRVGGVFKTRTKSEDANVLRILKGLISFNLLGALVSEKNCRTTLGRIGRLIGAAGGLAFGPGKVRLESPRRATFLRMFSWSLLS